MSLAVEVVASSAASKNMGFEDENSTEGSKAIQVDRENEYAGNSGTVEEKTTSENHVDATDQDEADDNDGEEKLQLGPQQTLKEQYEKDKDDESLRRWKEQLLGSLDINSVAEILDPEVKITSLAIKSPGRSDILLPIPESGNPKGLWFTLKEGSRYSLKFTFQVRNNIVSGLKYRNTVWKTGLKVDNTKAMIGTFSPQQEPYTHEMPEETTPSGMFARGSYSARSKFLDDDNKCYLVINYTFDIRKEWQ